MEKIKLNTKRCKGCYLCVSVCPVKALSPSGELGEQGFVETAAFLLHVAFMKKSASPAAAATECALTTRSKF